MYTRRILLRLIFLGIIIHVVENKLEINPDYPLEVHMMKLESELQPDSAESTYVRVIAWNQMPTSEHLQHHFDKFDLLRLEEEKLANGKFDVIEKSESTYERFLYAHYPEQQLIVTIFVKVNFNSERNPFSLKYFIKKVNRALKKYSFIDTDEIIDDQIDSNTSILYNEFIVGILMISSLFICFKLLYPRNKKENLQKNGTKTDPSSKGSHSELSVNGNDNNEQKHADLTDTTHSKYAKEDHQNEGSKTNTLPKESFPELPVNEKDDCMKGASQTYAPATVAPQPHLLSRPTLSPSQNLNSFSLLLSPTPTSSSSSTPSPSAIRGASAVGEQVSLGSKCPGSIIRATEKGKDQQKHAASNDTTHLDDTKEAHQNEETKTDLLPKGPSPELSVNGNDKNQQKHADSGVITRLRVKTKLEQKKMDS